MLLALLRQLARQKERLKTIAWLMVFCDVAGSSPLNNLPPSPTLTNHARPHNAVHCILLIIWYWVQHWQLV